jgi:DNA-3-methyladenine glycosylase I
MQLEIGEDGLARCGWGASSPDYVAYHDDEWGVGVADDHRLFEKICLEGFQSGLAWITILRKRDNFRAAFAGFDPARVASFGERNVERLLGDAGIVRHQGKIRSTINNAGRALALIDEFGSLAAYFWPHATFADRAPGEIPATRSSAAVAIARRSDSISDRGSRPLNGVELIRPSAACTAACAAFRSRSVTRLERIGPERDVAGLQAAHLRLVGRAWTRSRKCTVISDRHRPRTRRGSDQVPRHVALGDDLAPAVEQVLEMPTSISPSSASLPAKWW